jgi:hypothetical protein
MPNVLVSGAPERVAAVSEVLRDHGCTVVGVDDLEQVPAACAEAGSGAFDAYIQLPAAFVVEGDTAVQRVNHLFTCGVMARFPAIDAAVRALKPGARVRLVMWELPPEVATQDEVDARQALMRVLGHAMHADAADDQLSVRVMGSKSTPEEIALAALGKDASPEDAVASLSSTSYADWRVELLGLVSVES